MKLIQTEVLKRIIPFTLNGLFFTSLFFLFVGWAILGFGTWIISAVLSILYISLYSMVAITIQNRKAGREDS